jgi:molybdopterin molybdotransferase
VTDLLSIDAARERVLEAVTPLPDEPVPIDRLVGRALAADARSAVDVPPFDSSAMDGYAVLAGPGAELRLVDESRAGHPASATVEQGTAVSISTGAQVPAGADAVIPVERTEGRDGAVAVPDVEPGANIRPAGEVVRAGDVVLPAGTVIGPGEVALLASLGQAEVRCAARPRLVLLVTGDELVEPGRPLAPGQIWSSNGYALAGQAAASGALVLRRETVPDDPDGTRSVLERALADADVVCVSGGVSVGPHDHVKPALESLGVEERFWGVALKPGKPTWFGATGRVLVFGLPGNPVSAMVTFQLFARPALRALQGAAPVPGRTSAVLDEPLPCNPRRQEVVRVRLRAGADGWHARSTGGQDSHMLTSMVGADALAFVGPGEGEVAAGERLEIELL